MKRGISVFLSLAMLLSMFVFCVNATEISGSCGKNLTWKVDESTGILTISGSGEMDSWERGYDSCPAPWGSCKFNKVVISEGVTGIGDAAFVHCRDLEEIIIPETVTSIGAFALEECSIKSVKLPKTLKSIGNAAFVSTGLTEIEIPEGVKSLDSTFFDCRSLEKAVLPNSLETIGRDVFYSTALKSITIPKHVTSIGNDAFMNCRNLQSIELPESVTSLGDGAFSDCTALTQVKLPHHLSKIPEICFGNCESLETLEIPEGVTTIGRAAFESCIKLSDVKIAASVKIIDNNAFSHCYQLTSVCFYGDAPAIGDHVFQNLELVFDIDTYRMKDEYTNIPGLILYYVQGKKGWTSPTWNGYPTATWKPGQDEPSKNLFTDVKEGEWYYDAVKYAVKNKLFNGMSATTFEPNTPMSRAMLVTVLWRHANVNVGGTECFVDVNRGAWYFDAVNWAHDNLIVDGIGKGCFGPNESVTREQLATILYRYCNGTEAAEPVEYDLSQFPDGNKVGLWAREAMQWAIAEGLIHGNSVGGQICIDPQGNATRAQVATILMRFLEKSE